MDLARALSSAKRSRWIACGHGKSPALFTHHSPKLSIRRAANFGKRGRKLYSVRPGASGDHAQGNDVKLTLPAVPFDLLISNRKMPSVDSLVLGIFLDSKICSSRNPGNPGVAL